MKLDPFLGCDDRHGGQHRINEDAFDAGIDQPDAGNSGADEPARGLVGHIAEVRNGREHTFPRRFTRPPRAVDDVRDRHGGYARPLGDGLDCEAIFVLSGSAHPLATL